MDAPPNRQWNRPEWTRSPGRVLIASALIGQAIIMATLTEGSYRDAITLLVTAVGTIEYAIGCLLLAREEDGAGGAGCVGLVVVGLGWIFLWLMLLFL